LAVTYEVAPARMTDTAVDLERKEDVDVGEVKPEAVAVGCDDPALPARLRDVVAIDHLVRHELQLALGGGECRVTSVEQRPQRSRPSAAATARTLDDVAQAPKRNQVAIQRVLDTPLEFLGVEDGGAIEQCHGGCCHREAAAGRAVDG
jgi:hypothetical protein